MLAKPRLLRTLDLIVERDVPGRMRDGTTLGLTATVFPAGHRIRVQVSSSDFPQWDRNLNTGGPPGMEGAARARVATQIVLHDRDHASRITLPVVAP